MRNQNYFALMSAALLTGAVAFTACSSDDELAGDNTGSNPAAGEVVKTQFAINIPYGPKTRMSAENTQNNSNFLGMYDIYLLPLTSAGTASSAFTSVIPLAAFNGFDGGSSNYKLYSDVNIPVGTKNFLFYGMGGTAAPTTAGDKFAKGILTSTLKATAKAEDVKFNLNTILTGTDFTTQLGEMVDILNDVAAAEGWSTQADNELAALYEKYQKLVGGSANAVKLTLEELYNAVNTMATATDESTQKTVATAIQTKIKTYFTPTEADGNITLAWTTENTFPTDLNVPEGAAQVDWQTDKFVAVSRPTVGTEDNALDVYNLCYPASIAYFVNTPLWATSQMTVTWPNTAAGWIAEGAFSGWGDVVTATTRNVALKNNIQYGVARLETTVKCKTATLEDNAQAVAGLTSNQSIVVPSAGFPVSAVLVGGQPDFVGWDMHPVAAANFTQTVYDNALTGIVAKFNEASATNYTLLLDNKQNTPSVVNIAIELTNNTGTDFYGVDGKVANGAKFYLVAQLNPQGTTEVTKPEGVTDVFQQDFTTKASLTISSLKNAYVTIPDLRASELSLGLSVDLQWQTGMTFDVEIQ